MSEWMGLSLIDWLVVLGVAGVLPLAVGGPWRAWAAAATTVALSFLLPVGVAAAALVLPWGSVAAWRLRTALARSVTPETGLVPVLAAGWATVAAGALVFSRAGWTMFGIYEPIVELTAVHYTYAGAGALVLAGATLAGRHHRLSLAAVVLTAGAPPVVAAGFVTGTAYPQVGGAVLMAAGVCLTGLLHLAEAARPGARRAARALLALSGLAIWAPMALAVAWAAGQHWQVPALSVPDMARTHGVANAIAFTLGGLVARRLAPKRETETASVSAAAGAGR